MKFVCERCHTKYSIADDKVRQKILKIRCKTCENVITIRDAVVVNEPALQRAAPPPAPAARPPRSVEWHLAVNGRQEGPLGLAALCTRIQSARREDELYVWNEHLDGWKDPKAVAEVSAELRARAALATSTPPPPPRRPPTPPGVHGGGGGRAGLPPPSGRSSPGMPAVGGRPSGSMPAVAARASGSMPAVGHGARAGLAGFATDVSEDEKTQISLDAGAMFDGNAAKAKPDRRSGNMAVPVEGGNGAAAAARSVTSNGLESLDFVPVPVAQSKRPALTPAGGHDAGGGAVAAPIIGGSTSMLLSQIGGRVGRVRHPAIKYVVTGSVLVVLVIVVAVLSMTGKDKTQAASKPVVAVSSPQPGADPEAVARAEAERYFKSMVGEGAATPNAKNVGPAPRRSGPTPRPRGPEPTRPPPVAPPPIGVNPQPVDGTSVARRFTQDERKVAPTRGQPNRGGGTAAPSGGNFDQTKVLAVVKQQDHYNAIKSCYERALKRDDKLRQGRLDIHVTVGETGSVRRVRIDPPTDFGGASSCIRDTVRRWRFPSNTEEYEAAFPLILQGTTE
jgi:predicted Zn finger-like uncharacterized protein